ncbi:hypothetical protein V474_01940 [Novosphingobium barchaimii LL02]|uniref:Uncharacterized protein n=1 Tax=Novosphingobium barchaimii LL02 TaxID=1114963 RepID=A0A0J7XL41_9SPHN|nr:hypothetical protein [Novosphingobium barchaimii]KMS51823.1 hypothetical protein V474_01940 [Novosphingobium barchaimii LL02]
MSETQGSGIPGLDDWDRSDPDPWLALWMDRSLPIAPAAKAALIRDQRSRSRQFLLPIVRPFARLWIVIAQLVHTVTPRWPHAPRFLHASIAFGMKHFLTPDANRLILRHFHLGAQVLRFISDNATPGFHPPLEPMTPRRIDDVRANLFLNHDLNIYNYLIGLNAELDRRDKDIDKVERIDFSAITEDVELEELPRGRFNVIDLQTAIECYTPAYAMFLTDRDFWRATNSLQLDETIGLYAARLTGEEKHLAMIVNGHPLVPHSTLRAGFRLMLHGLSTELLHGFLVHMKRRQSA